MRLKKYFHRSLQAVGTGVLLMSINNCAPQNASSSLESMDGKADVAVSTITDGDHHVTILGDSSLPAINVSKVYFNNSTDPTNAPRWKDGAINWYYNPSGAPSSLSSSALSVIQQSMAYWSSYCNIKFNYMGETSKLSQDGPRDSANVVGWGDAGGATGVTYVSIRGSTLPLPISEADIDLNISDVRDATTLRAVMNHELGHMLGLRHSDVSESIMFANPYHDIQYLLTLRADDISGCVGLYGAAGGVEEAPATETPSTQQPPSTEGSTEMPSTEGSTDTPTTPPPSTEGSTDTPTTPPPSTEGSTDTPTTPPPSTEGSTDTPTTPPPSTEGSSCRDRGSVTDGSSSTTQQTSTRKHRRWRR